MLCLACVARLVSRKESSASRRQRRLYRQVRRMCGSRLSGVGELCVHGSILRTVPNAIATEPMCNDCLAYALKRGSELLQDDAMRKCK